MKAIYLAAALAAFSAPALAQNAETAAQPFVKAVAVSDMFEVQSSRLAAKMSKSGDVKQFANQMITDHTKTSSELKGLAKQDKLTVPTQLDSKHAQMLKQLKSTSRADFDSNYKQMQVAAHQDAVSLFQAYSQQGDNPDLRSWASKTLPTLQQHLQHAQSLNASEQTGKRTLILWKLVGAPGRPFLPHPRLLA
jgi:putative membrane protein